MASQTVVGPEIQFSQDNLFCYAFSGAVSVSGETDLLSFQNGSGFIKAEIQITSESDSDNDFASRLYVNDIQVAGTRYLAAYPAKRHGFDRPLYFFIPPHAKIRVAQQRLTGSGTSDWYCTLVGRVYEHLPVRN